MYSNLFYCILICNMLFDMEMRTYKSFVRNKSRPERSIAKAYIESECLTICSRYLSMTKTQFNRLERNEYSQSPMSYKLVIFSKVGKPLGKASPRKLDIDEWRKAHLYILKNYEEVQPFFEQVFMPKEFFSKRIHLINNVGKYLNFNSSASMRMLGTNRDLIFASGLRFK